MTTVHTVKSKVKILQNFVAFSEYMNFNTIQRELFGSLCPTQETRNHNFWTQYVKFRPLC